MAVRLRKQRGSELQQQVEFEQRQLNAAFLQIVMRPRAAPPPSSELQASTDRGLQAVTASCLTNLETSTLKKLERAIGTGPVPPQRSGREERRESDRGFSSSADFASWFGEGWLTRGTPNAPREASSNSEVLQLSPRDAWVSLRQQQQKQQQQQRAPYRLMSPRGPAVSPRRNPTFQPESVLDYIEDCMDSLCTTLTRGFV